MKRFFLAYLSSLFVLLIILLIHYVEIMQMALGDAYSEIVWKAEVMWMVFWMPYFGLVVLQSILFFGGFLVAFNIFRKRREINAKYFLPVLIGLSFLAAALFLGLFEPILSMDYFEYGTRQELNKVFERIGYPRINVTVYIYLALTAILTWSFVRKVSNKTKAKLADSADHSDLLDH